jgi:arylsulfatase A-like enzyme
MERAEGRQAAELVDVYPTLLKAAGIEVPEQAVGMNLLEKNETRPLPLRLA